MVFFGFFSGEPPRQSLLVLSGCTMLPTQHTYQTPRYLTSSATQPSGQSQVFSSEDDEIIKVFRPCPAGRT